MAGSYAYDGTLLDVVGQGVAVDGDWFELLHSGSTERTRSNVQVSVSMPAGTGTWVLEGRNGPNDSPIQLDTGTAAKTASYPRLAQMRLRWTAAAGLTARGSVNGTLKNVTYTPFAVQSSLWYNGIVGGHWPGDKLPLILDSYNRADNAVTPGSTDTGEAYSLLQGAWGVSGDQLYATSLGGDGQGAIVVPALWSDVVLSGLMPGSVDGAGLLWRAQDNLNYFIFERESAGTVLAAYKRVNSTSFTAITSVGHTFDSADVFAVHMLGNKAVVTVNGAPLFTITDAFLQTATGFGWRNTSIASRFDNLRIAKADTRLVVDGDSISSGFNLAPNNSWPSTLCGRVGYETFSLINTATAGANVNFDMIGRIASDDSYRAVGGPYTNSLLLIWAGTNDIIAGRTAAQVEADTWTCIDTHVANGWPQNKIAIATIIPRDATLNSFSQATFDSLAADVNSRFRSHYAAHCGRLIDFAADSHYSSPTAFTDSTIYLDRIHPTLVGVGVLADIASPIIKQMVAA